MQTFENLKFSSTGWVVKKKDGTFSYKVRLHILPFDDVLEAEGENFNLAINAAARLASIYGQKMDDLIKEHGDGL